MWRWPKRALPALAVMTLVAAAGCSLSVPGVAVKASGGPPPDAVDESNLVTGNYQTTPAPPLGAAGSQGAGALIDSRRMANNVVGPWEVDSSLVTPSPLRAMVLKDAATVGLFAPSGVSAAVHAHSFINGFSSDRSDANQQRLMNAVLRFADPPSAAAAAADMAAATLNQPDAPKPMSKLSVPDHPDALAFTDSSGGEQHSVTVVSYTPHGPYVLCQTVQAGATDIGTALISKTLDLQGPLIDQFTPTDPARFADLPLDPTGLLARTMRYPTWPEPEGWIPTNPKVGVYPPHGALHFQDDPLDTAAALSSAGVQAMAYYQTLVYQARDAASAAQLAIDLANVSLETQLSAAPSDGVSFMPTSRCVQTKRPNGTSLQYSCYAPAGTYTIEAHSADPMAAHQQVAAQYKMLLGK
jgi:hypothetical protein